MKPVRHGASNFVYKGPAPGIGDLWCQRVEPREVRIVYEFDDAEREQIAQGRLVRADR